MVTVGTVLGGFRLVAPIGGGAMGTVWRAAAEAPHGRDVAIKLLSEKLVHRADLRERFEREAQLARQVDHPAVCRLFEHGTTPDGVPYLAMEMLEGMDLGDRLHGAAALNGAPALNGEAFVEHMLQALDGLAAVHVAGVVHRDLKPDNIFLQRADDGTEHAKLLDFGVSKATGDDKQLTATGQVLGTPTFMAPEQAASARKATAASDLYALGAILYDGLAGRPPFDADTSSLATLLLAIAFEEPVPLRQVRPQVPDEVGAVIAKALQKAPTDRYRDAEAMRDALRAALDSHRTELRALVLERTEGAAIARPADGAASGPASAEATADRAAVSAEDKRREGGRTVYDAVGDLTLPENRTRLWVMLGAGAVLAAIVAVVALL